MLVLKFLCDKHNHKYCSYDFCEAQTGKDICDRKISTLRTAINQYLNNGKDILFASDIKSAIDNNKFLENGVRAYVCETNDSLDFKNMFKFPNVTNYHSFEFKDPNNMTFYRHYKIGKGETKKVEDFLEKGFNMYSVVNSLKGANLSIIEDDQFNKEASLEKKKKPSFETFTCSIVGCCQIFFDEIKLEKHLDDHNSIRNLPQLKKILIKYVTIINGVRSKNFDSNASFKIDNLSNILKRMPLGKGFALKKRNQSKLNPENSLYLLDIFKAGINKKQKASPEGVKDEMILLVDRFDIEERLSADEIKSFFSRMNTLFNTHKLEEFEKRLRNRLKEYVKNK
jgi:hypothetical protein